MRKATKRFSAILSGSDALPMCTSEAKKYLPLSAIYEKFNMKQRIAAATQ
mgnify:CR=1 FL=1